ncbi:MAG: zf-HC2 domain-containing protein [Lachnospiraceae bacterium]|nr:zf-HC2 domain-containing protein [Lachnospiraceae bacterium]
MKNEKCSLIKDLLPSYIDELTSEETNKEIENHLSECPDCKKIYESMKGDIPGEKEIESGEKYDEDLLRKISLDVKKKTNRSKTAFIIAIVAIVLLFVLLNLPIVPVSQKNIYAKVTKPALMLDSAGRKYNNVPENSVLLYEDEDDFDEVYFHKVIFRDSSMENDGIIYYATDNVDLWYFSIVEIDSKKPIRAYKTKVQNYEGENVLTVSGVRTSVLGSLFARKDTVSKVTLTDTDGITGVYLKKGRKLEKIDL